MAENFYFELLENGQLEARGNYSEVPGGSGILYPIKDFESFQVWLYDQCVFLKVKCEFLKFESNPDWPGFFILTERKIGQVAKIDVVPNTNPDLLIIWLYEIAKPGSIPIYKKGELVGKIHVNPVARMLRAALLKKTTVEDLVTKPKEDKKNTSPTEAYRKKLKLALIQHYLKNEKNIDFTDSAGDKIFKNKEILLPSDRTMRTYRKLLDAEKDEILKAQIRNEVKKEFEEDTG